VERVVLNALLKSTAQPHNFIIVFGEADPPSENRGTRSRSADHAL